MGFSSTICAAIILASLLLIIGSAETTLFLTLREGFSTWIDAYRGERARLDVRLQLNITWIGDRAANITVRNTGSRAVFLASGWNDVVVAYNASGHWRPFLSSFEVERIRVIGSGDYFTPQSHPFINPGEEALISVQLPEGAPNIPRGSPVIVVFASHYGVSAVGEAVRP